MTDSFEEDWGKLCRRLMKQVSDGRISFEECADRLTLEIVSGEEDCIIKCIDGMPIAMLTPYAAYLRDHVEAVEFMPSPLPFLADRSDEQAGEETLQRLKPLYQRLCQLVRARCKNESGGEETGRS